MKTTLVIDDQVMAKLKQEAARRGKTISELVESALRLFLRPASQVKELPPLPTFDGGELLVDICDKEKLYDVLDND
ncbi:MAG: ribbon-helix-helix protein, CopG family [Planctomycetota bacterium]